MPTPQEFCGTGILPVAKALGRQDAHPTRNSEKAKLHTFAKKKDTPLESLKDQL
jgi:hypothetical protein